MTSARTAVPSSVKTIQAPRRPSGFSLISRTQTARKRERARGTVVCCTALPSTVLALEIISAFLQMRFHHPQPSPQPSPAAGGEGAQRLTIADARIKVCVAEVHDEIQQEP